MEWIVQLEVMLRWGSTLEARGSTLGARRSGLAVASQCMHSLPGSPRGKLLGGKHTLRLTHESLFAQRAVRSDALKTGQPRATTALNNFAPLHRPE